MEDKKYRRSFIIIGAAVVIIIVLTTIFTVPELFSRKDPSGPVTTTPAPSPSAGAAVPATSFSTEGIITALSYNDRSLTVADIRDGIERTMTFAGHTEVMTSYSKRISASQLKVGDFVKVTYDGSFFANEITGSADVWSYRNVFNLVIDSAIPRISIGDRVYHYDDNIRFMHDGEFIPITSLSSLDVFDVYGIGDYVYLIRIACGHGYLSLEHLSDYNGGTLYINGDVYCQITDSMAPITLSEGEYNVAAEYLSLFGSADIRISCFETSVFDLSPFAAPAIEYGNVTFSITPRDAFLYIDGVKTKSSKPVSLTYGKHTIEVSLAGYTSFKGSLNVNRPSMSYAVTLPKAAAVPDDLLYNSDSYSEEYAEPVVTVPKYSITVYCTEGSSVYVDGELKGTIKKGSFTFERPDEGFVSIRFELKGCEPAEYAITVEPDDKDIKVTFPDMVPIE